jgi:hypothetical protein
MLGATTAGSVPNRAWLMDAATARRSPSSAGDARPDGLDRAVRAAARVGGRTGWKTARTPTLTPPNNSVAWHKRPVLLSRRHPGSADRRFYTLRQGQAVVHQLRRSSRREGTPRPDGPQAA